MKRPIRFMTNQRAIGLEELRTLAADARLYAVIDACDTPEVPVKARELGRRRAVSLYHGTVDEMYWAIAPYLFAVDDKLLDWIVSELWTEPWGIFAVADRDLEAVRRHFRRFLLVQSAGRDQLYFRFYDPRVLPAFIQDSAFEEFGQIWGSLECFIVAAPAQLTRYDLVRSRISITRRIRITTQPAPPETRR